MKRWRSATTRTDVGDKSMAKNQKAEAFDYSEEKLREAWRKPMTDFELALQNAYDMTNGLDKVPGSVGSLQSARDAVNDLGQDRHEFPVVSTGH